MRSEARDVGGGNGAADEVALAAVAAHDREHVERRAVLDAFGADLEPQVVAELDQRADHGVRFAAVRHVHDETLVDLHLVERHLIELCQRRIAGAEIVERQADALHTQPRENRHRGRRVLDRRRLGDLEHELAAVDTILCEQSGDAVGKAQVRHEARRQVDGAREPEPLVLPRAHLLQGRIQHRARELADEPALLGQRDELVRHHYAQARVLPARESFDAVDDPAALHERRFRLVVRNEFVARNAAAQVLDVEVRALVQHRRQLRLQLDDGNRLLERAAHRKPMAHAELMRSRQHALVDGADQHDVGRARARAERAQQLDAVGVGQVQLHHDQRRLEGLEQLDERRARLGARDRIADLRAIRPTKSPTAPSSSTIRSLLTLSAMHRFESANLKA